ncbi:MBL fold metallo-hydrolase [Paenibacillus chartarius]|uniref:MBL fold metallo-hydrolase n=1 Tax=Paenibacillus chartarius TaxID=747481 RepID=A0ABV6DS88_9BACL
MHHLMKISDRFWYYTPVGETDRPILGMVVGTERTLMIDAGNSPAHAREFLKALAGQNVAEPDMVVLTHAHWDHIFGLSALEGVLSVSSAHTREKIAGQIGLSWSDEALEERARSWTVTQHSIDAIRKEFGQEREIALVETRMTFTDRLEVDLGGVTCVLQHVGGDHAADSSVVYIPEEKLLFLADCLCPDIHAPQRNYTPRGTVELLDRLDAFDAEVYIWSHGGLTSKEEYRQEAALLRAIAGCTEQFGGDRSRIAAAYAQELSRELNEYEQETIDYFVSGYGLGNKPI